jgi:hypothetical protein
MNRTTSVMMVVVGLVLTMSMVGCSHSDSPSSEISVVASRDTQGACTTAAQNYGIDLNGASTWHLVVDAKNTSCPSYVEVSLGIKSAVGNAGVVTSASARAYDGATNRSYFEADLIAGTYQVLIDGKPTDVIITVSDASKPTVTTAPK